MRKYSFVNWSEIARNAIIERIATIEKTEEIETFLTSLRDWKSSSDIQKI